MNFTNAASFNLQEVRDDAIPVISLFYGKPETLCSN